MPSSSSSSNSSSLSSSSQSSSSSTSTQTLSTQSSQSSVSSSQSSSSSSTYREFQPTDIGAAEQFDFFDSRKLTMGSISDKFSGKISGATPRTGNAPAQATAASQPTYGDFNGRAGVSCSGGESLEFTPSISNTATQWMIILLLRIDSQFAESSGASNTVFLYQTNTTNSNGVSISFDQATQEYIFAVGPTSEGIRVNQRVLMGETVVTLVGDHDQRLISLYLNGNLYDQKATTQASLGSDANSASFTSGSDGINVFGGYVAYSQILSDSRRQDVEAWMAQGVTSRIEQVSGRIGNRGAVFSGAHKWAPGAIHSIESSASSGSSASSSSQSSSSSASSSSHSSSSQSESSSSSHNSSSSSTLDFSTSSQSSSSASSSST